jgi:hypothetical protein
MWMEKSIERTLRAMAAKVSAAFWGYFALRPTNLMVDDPGAGQRDGALFFASIFPARKCRLLRRAFMLSVLCRGHYHGLLLLVCAISSIQGRSRALVRHGGRLLNSANRVELGWVYML